MLLADVRSVGVQGDGRTYGHPIVLRPVSSEDAMTADWTRLPYELLAKYNEPHGFFNYKNRIELYKRIDQFLAQHMPAETPAK